MSPSASNVRSVPERTREDMSGMSRNSSLNLTVCLSAITSRTNRDHLFPKRDTMFRMGQVCMSGFWVIEGLYVGLGVLVGLIMVCFTM